MAYATTYTQDPNLSDFTLNQYGTFIAAPFGDLGTTPPYTPTNVQVIAGLRVYGNDATQPVIVNTGPASEIRVFSNIDHFGSAYDGYQYAILGSNDNVTYTPLFDALTVTGSGEPFTLGTFTGTAPVRVNNVLTPGAGPNGTVGYIADFYFNHTYTYFKFNESTVANVSGNVDQELTAVGAIPEPSSLALVSSAIPGFLGLGWLGRRKTRRSS